MIKLILLFGFLIGMIFGFLVGMLCGIFVGENNYITKH